MNEITFRADARLIEAKRQRVRAEHSSPNAQFRRWLAGDAQPPEYLERYDEVMAGLRGQLRLGRPVTRGERNAR